MAELKTKVHTEFEIPTDVQRWIIGKNLAERDGATLDELHAVDGSPVFLYLVAPGNLTRSNQTNHYPITRIIIPFCNFLLGSSLLILKINGNLF